MWRSFFSVSELEQTHSLKETWCLNYRKEVWNYFVTQFFYMNVRENVFILENKIDHERHLVDTFDCSTSCIQARTKQEQKTIVIDHIETWIFMIGAGSRQDCDNRNDRSRIARVILKLITSQHDFLWLRQDRGRIAIIATITAGLPGLFWNRITIFFYISAVYDPISPDPRQFPKISRNLHLQLFAKVLWSDLLFSVHKLQC